MPIAIVGTGRSGTSMVARMLNLCGVYLGEPGELATKDEWNPTGFWEHAGIDTVNRKVLTALGASYDNPPRMDERWEYDAELDEFYDEACSLIERSFTGHGEWGWKLPGTTLTLPFWQRVIPELKLVVCARNPLDYAASAQKYLRIVPEHSLAIWLYYNFYLLQAKPLKDSIITIYETYFPDYRNGLDPLLDALGLERPPIGGEIDCAIRDFHSPDLKHHSTPFHEFIADSTVPFLAKELYLEMLGHRTGSDDLPIVKHAETYLPILRQAITPDIVDRSKEAELMHQLSELQRRTEHLEQILASSTHRLAAKVCDLLIRFPVTRLLRRSSPAKFGYKPAPAPEKQAAEV